MMSSAALGQVLVLASLGWTAAVMALAIAGAARNNARFVRAAGWGLRAAGWIGVAMALVLLHALLVHDFGIKYVAQYTDTDLPLLYVLTAFWGGEKGALAFWVVGLAILGALLARSRADDDSPYTGWVLGTVAGALLFFDIVMVFASSPFETFAASGGPADGSGLNPLLQTPLMAIHPPPQLLGFIAYTIPFAFAVGALAAGRTDGKWVVDARRWNLFAWAMLSAGLVVGELWSYLELGWGGYWGWDPVENAELLPWLTGTAMIHTFTTEFRAGLLRRWNVVLASLTFLLTIFATFLTRSQLIQSLHSFSGSLLTPFFLWYQVVLIAVAGGLIAWRWRSLVPAGRIESYLSREAVVVGQALLFLMATFVVMWGTLLPKFSESPAVLAVIDRGLAAMASLTGGQHVPLTGAVNVGPEWFNKVVGPIGIAILALIAAGPALPLRQAPGPEARRTLVRTLLTGFVLGLLTLVALVALRGLGLASSSGMDWGRASWLYFKGLSWPGAYGLVAATFAFMLLGVAGLDWVRGVRARRAAKGESPWTAAAVLFRENPRRFGGHIVHVGIALTFLGFAGAAGKLEKKDVVLEPQERLALGGHDLFYVGSRERWEPTEGYAALEAHFLALDRGETVSPAVVEAVRAAAPGAKSVDAADAPYVRVTFEDAAAARAFQASVAVRTLLAPGAVATVDAARREVRLSPRRPEILRVLPESMQRMADAAKQVGAALGGDRLTVRLLGRGDPVVLVTAKDDGALAVLRAGLEAKGDEALLAAKAVKGHPLSVDVVAAGTGRAMEPEMRFYLKSENPTTEVHITPGFLTDLYIAATPAKGGGAVNVTVMDHPMMSVLWLGAVVGLLAAAALVAPVSRRRQAAAAPRAAGAGTEGAA
jgi:cytochrome c-type biogenesis protein CcmF